MGSRPAGGGHPAVTLGLPKQGVHCGPQLPALHLPRERGWCPMGWPGAAPAPSDGGNTQVGAFGTSRSGAQCQCPSPLSTRARIVIPPGPATPPGDPALVPNPKRDSRGGRGPRVPPPLGTTPQFGATTGLGGAMRGSSISQELPLNLTGDHPVPKSHPAPFPLATRPAPALPSQRPWPPAPGGGLSPPREGRAPLRGSSQHPASLGITGPWPRPRAWGTVPKRGWVGRCHLYSTSASNECPYNIFIFYILDISCTELF